ncbi:MAG: integrase [Bacteroidetes bacterium]|nr:MAG: integrase [Bacteroidota bacterium]
MKMKMKNLTAAELIKVTKDELVKTGFTNLTLKGIERVWVNLEKYLHDNDFNYFSLDLGMAFLKERYHITGASNLSPTNQLRLRAIQLLADFQFHQRIVIRRKQKQYEFAQPFETIFTEFMNFRKNVGISNTTLESNIIYLERFSQYLFNHGINHEPEINIEHIHGFIQSSSAFYSTSTIYCTCCLLRVLFRYLFDQKVITEDLSTAVPSIKCSKKSKIPYAYSQEEIRQLLQCVDRGNPKGKRDYAMLLIAIRLGMRASDICKLTFDNLKWESNTIEFKQNKNGHTIILPLLNDVGKAVIDYIKYARPAVETNKVFLRLCAPIGRLQAPTLHSIVTHYMNKAGIFIPKGKKHGPHALRHSLASALLHNNTPMPVISEVLGHADSQSTSTYLKIDTLNLRKYALDVPSIKVVLIGGII